MRNNSGENRRTSLEHINARENTAYHDELKFLQTQLHKAELYWNVQTFWQRLFLQRQYKQIHGSLKNEIALFKTEHNRSKFTRSCMKAKDFKAIQLMRKRYVASQNEL